MFRGTFCAVLLALVACSSSDPVPLADAGTSPTTPPAGGDAGGSGVVNNCTTFVDRRTEEASRTLLWDFAIATAAERCIQISAGQTVTFGNGSHGPGDFAMHPLIEGGGDKNSPIESYDEKTGIVKFPNAGTFGFRCGNHPEMNGAVKVTAP